MKKLDISWLVGAALVMTLPAQAIAQTSPEQPATVTAADTAAHGGGFGNAVASAALEGYRGGTDIVNNDMRLAGTTAGNTAINVATGGNAISSGAFTSMSGLPVVIQNSGANVLIQNAVILNLQIN